MRHQTNGDYGQAISIYLSMRSGDSTPAQVREADYHLAECYLLNGEYLAAAAAWEEFLAEYPDDDRLPQAALMAARAFNATNEYTRAIFHYEAYLIHETVLTDVVQEWIGDCHAALSQNSTEPDGELEEAIAAYRLALDFADDRGVRVSLREKIAGVHLALEDYDAALAEYDAILDVARIDNYRAKIEYLAGLALAAADQAKAAHARYRRAVDNYPEAEHAYLSLIELVDAGVEVDEFQRGLVDYYAGAAYPGAYEAAIRAFDRYLASGSADRADEALYYKALTQLALEQPEASLEALEMLIDGYPDSESLADAWLEKGATLTLMEDNDAAVKTYQDLAAFFPGDDLAPKALWRAARIREGEGAYVEAAKLYEDVQAAFPGFEDADSALWRAGLAYYRDGDPQAATSQWQALVEKYPKSPYYAKSLYWLGKLGQGSASHEDSDHWDKLVALDPHAYYALRVEQIRTGGSLTATRLVTAGVELTAWDVDQAAVEIQTWMQDWVEIPADTDLATLPPTTTRRLDLQRGQTLLAVGLRRDALQAFDGVRVAAWGDPLALARLSLFFHDLGLHGLAARCAVRLAGLWPGGSIHDTPMAVRYLAYPLVYADLLSAEALAFDLDPLLLAAVFRQESYFEPVAESYAGARGLAQVMPATGEGIARSLGVDDFDLKDLFRPSVSIRFGAFYLSVQMGRFEDQVLVALAAYNGGPGNTLRWLEGIGDDLDLFVEVITASQSRIYLQTVYEQYITYESLYRPSAAGERAMTGED